MQTQVEGRRDDARPKRAARRPRHAETADWRREQDRMVDRILPHAMAGGAQRAGAGASAEQSVDAYLEVLRRDLLAFAQREG